MSKEKQFTISKQALRGADLASLLSNDEQVEAAICEALALPLEEVERSIESVKAISHSVIRVAREENIHPIILKVAVMKILADLDKRIAEILVREEKE